MIDWTRLDSLHADLGPGFDEVVEVFLAEADAAVAALDPGAPLSQVAADLHFLKGAALNLGFTVFAGLCAAGEARANMGRSVELDPIRRAYAASRADFDAGQARRRTG